MLFALCCVCQARSIRTVVQYRNLILSDSPSLVFFKARACRQCQYARRQLVKESKDRGLQHRIFEADVVEANGLFKELQVAYVPTLSVHLQGQHLYWGHSYKEALRALCGED